MERKFNYSLCGVVVAAMVSCLAFVSCDGIADITTCTTDADCTETQPECLLVGDTEVEGCESCDAEAILAVANLLDGEGVCTCTIAEDGTDSCGDGATCKVATGACQSDGTDDACENDDECGAGYYCMEDDADGDAGDDDDDDAGDDDDDDAGDEEEHAHGHCRARPTDCNDEHAADCEDGQVCGTDGVCSDLGCTDDGAENCAEGKVCDARTTLADGTSNADHDVCVDACDITVCLEGDEGDNAGYELCLVDEVAHADWNDCSAPDNVTNTGCGAAAIFANAPSTGGPVIYDVMYAAGEVDNGDACGNDETAHTISFKYMDEAGDVDHTNGSAYDDFKWARDQAGFSATTASNTLIFTSGSDGSSGSVEMEICFETAPDAIAMQIQDNAGNYSNVACKNIEAAE